MTTSLLLRLRRRLSPWRPGQIGFCNAAGGLILLNSGATTYYIRTDLMPGCIVYLGCPVWRHKRTHQVTTQDPNV